MGDGTSGHDGALATSGIADNATLVYDLFGGQTAAYGISGSGSLVTSGPGTLVSCGHKYLYGGTWVEDGTLIVNSSLALPGGSRLTIGADGTFIFDPTATAEAVAGNPAQAVSFCPGGSPPCRNRER